MDIFPSNCIYFFLSLKCVTLLQAEYSHEFFNIFLLFSSELNLRLVYWFFLKQLDWKQLGTLRFAFFYSFYLWRPEKKTWKYLFYNLKLFKYFVSFSSWIIFTPFNERKTFSRLASSRASIQLIKSFKLKLRSSRASRLRVHEHTNGDFTRELWANVWAENTLFYFSLGRLSRLMI